MVITDDAWARPVVNIVADVPPTPTSKPIHRDPRLAHETAAIYRIQLCSIIIIIILLCKCVIGGFKCAKRVAGSRIIMIFDGVPASDECLARRNGNALYTHHDPIIHDFIIIAMNVMISLLFDCRVRSGDKFRFWRIITETRALRILYYNIVYITLKGQHNVTDLYFYFFAQKYALQEKISRLVQWSDFHSFFLQITSLDLYCSQAFLIFTV